MPPRNFDEQFIRTAVLHEHARTLADVLLRRTGWGSYSVPKMDVCKNTARVMAGLLGWADQQLESEIDHVAAHYQKLGLPV